MTRPKKENLEIAAIVAPVLRDQKRTRPIKIVDKDGKVIAERTAAQVTLGVMRRTGVELEVQPDAKPTHLTCESCGRPFLARAIGRGRQRILCKGCRTWICARTGCGELVGASTRKAAISRGKARAYCSRACRAEAELIQSTCARVGCGAIALGGDKYCSVECGAKARAAAKSAQAAVSTPIWICERPGCGVVVPDGNVKGARKDGRTSACCSRRCAALMRWARLKTK